ncbi:MAG TPA: hypothetical protein VGO61_04860 [Steroidobacteraceae bacterium]|jgi:hypothetical protein|nr:hypothetical protein [Steroidobacteraceae bacterium]
MKQNFFARLSCVLVALIPVLGFAQAADEAVKPMTVYDTALADGWQNWSWAKAELSVELKGSARKPIKVEAGPWQALYLHHEAFNTTGLKKLSLLIQGSAPDGLVRIFVLAEGKPLGEGYLVTLSNTGWKQVEQPLVVLGAEDKVIDGIWVQNASATDLPKFYVTEIKLQ